MCTRGAVALLIVFRLETEHRSWELVGSIRGQGVRAVSLIISQSRAKSTRPRANFGNIMWSFVAVVDERDVWVLLMSLSALRSSTDLRRLGSAYACMRRTYARTSEASRGKSVSSGGSAHTRR